MNVNEITSDLPAGIVTGPGVVAVALASGSVIVAVRVQGTLAAHLRPIPTVPPLGAGSEAPWTGTPLTTGAGIVWGQEAAGRVFEDG